MTNVFLESDLEILIATKNRNNLDFLVQMFPFTSFSNFNILIINQSSENQLSSDFEKVRVINVDEKGLSKSRNLAIKNATKKICLIADDDVVYFPNFDTEIITAFNQNPKASIITFNHQRIGKKEPHNRSKKVYSHSQKTIENVCSIEIGFQLNAIKNNNICFDENFGLGSYFETAEEYLFLLAAIKLKLNVIFSPFVIVSHPLLSSGEHQGDDKILFARAALFYKTKRNLAYIWLIKYVFFLFRNNYINWNECMSKYKIGLNGIQKYKELVKLKQ
ncbi:MAG TPA: glycosyltransferase family 2 protein [Flavobacterium alvei]|nr:glycosyltransferase family 2 protein [Flavobacterium alvei]HQK40014.1 glycosyltransferase family 2 protein [Flavobacterium alvei]